MQYSRFPSDEAKISKLGFGAMGFAGWFGLDDEKRWRQSLRYALDRGITFIDTARAYGESERIVGETLREWSGDRPFIATKIEGLGANRRWAIPVDVETVFPRGHVKLSAERSLKALNMDYVDLMQLHVWWPTWGVDGYWLDELLDLKERGLVRHIGVSIPDHRSDMALPLVQSGVIDSVQTIINIFDPLALDNLVPACEKHDVAVIARCVLDEGGLTGTMTKDTLFDEGDYRATYFDATVPREVYLNKVAALRSFVPEHASSLAALALKFVVDQPGITTALTSMHVQEYAESNISAVSEPELSADVLDALRTKHRFIKNFSNAEHWN